MLDVIIASFIIILSFSKTVHQCILHSTQSNCWRLLQCKTLNFLSPALWPHYSPELNSTMRFRESCNKTE